MIRRQHVWLLALWLCGCVDPHFIKQRAVFMPQLNDSPERYIIAGIENEEAVPAGHAGSSPKGYDTVTVYGPTSSALSLLKGIERDYQLSEITAWPIAPLHMHCAVLKIAQNANRASIIAALASDRRIRIAQPLQTFSTQTAAYDDPYVDLQRGFKDMDVAGAHAWSRGDGVRIAIIDTGADTMHLDLKGVPLHVRNFVDDDAEQFRRDRHGTELVGIIAAVPNNREGIVGIAPGARLWLLKACKQMRADGDAAQCNSFTLAQALTAAMDAEVQIVNLSLSGPPDPLLTELIRAGQKRGIVYVGAAAPPALRADHFLSIPDVITVTGDTTAAHSGSVHAPGKEILTLLPGSRYDFASGTSLATAHVTGVVALLLAKNAKLSAAEIFKVLRDTGTHGAAMELTAGLQPRDLVSVNACAAVTAMIGHGECGDRGTGSNRVAMH